MDLIRLLNACHHFPGFVSAAARLRTADTTIEIDHTFRVDGKSQRLRVHADRPASLPTADDLGRSQP